MTLGCGQLLRPRVTSVFGDMVRLMGNHEFFCCEKTDRRKAPFHKEVVQRLRRGRTAESVNVQRRHYKQISTEELFSLPICVIMERTKGLSKRKSLCMRATAVLFSRCKQRCHTGGTGIKEDIYVFYQRIQSSLDGWGKSRR